MAAAGSSSALVLSADEQAIRRLLEPAAYTGVCRRLVLDQVGLARATIAAIRG
jgi:hypothetical protein